MKSTYKTIILLTIVVIIYFITTILFSYPPKDTSSYNHLDTNIEISNSTPPPDNLTKAPFASEIESYLADYGTKYSFYIDPIKYAPIEVNSHKVRAASMIKVFILAYLAEQVSRGNISLDQEITLSTSHKVGGAGSLQGYANGTSLNISVLADKMITESDNTATNILIDLLSIDAINHYIQTNGYNDTILQRKMMDTIAISEGRENYTSAKDLGLFFQRLYHNQVINETWDIYMKNLLLNQTDIECIPTALPEKRIAHKTGELIGVYHDGGIIYSPNSDYILVLLSDSYNDRSEVLYDFQNISHYIDSKISTKDK